MLLIGCDPKSDTTSLLFGGRACPTIIETSAKKKLAGEEVEIGDVCFKRDGVFAMELGGPEVGRGCGGRGIIHGFELLEKLGFHEWGFDYVLLDFLGDVVCGGFGLPIARDMCQKVIVVGSNDLQSLYVANNVCSAVEYFRKLGGNVGVAGMVINKDDGTGEAQAFAEAVGIPVLAAIPADDDIRRKSANYEIIGRPDGAGAPLFEELAANVADAPPQRPTPLTQDELLGLFTGEAVGRDVVLEPATLRGHVRRHRSSQKPSLEVIYDSGLRAANDGRSRLDNTVAPTRRMTSPPRRWRRMDSAAMPARTRCAARPKPPARARRSALCQGLSARPARPAAKHVPGLRLAARRPAHAPHGDRAVGLGLLRLWPDLHLAFLRRAAHRRLRAVQFRDAGHRQAVRGHSRGGLQARRSRDLRRDRRHQSLRADRVRRAAAAAAEGDQRRAHHRHRRAGLRRADPCRGQGRARRRHAELCARLEAEQGPVAGAARGRARASRPSRCSARCSRPIRSASAACSSRWALPPVPSCRRANGANFMPRSTAPRSPRSIPSTPPASASSKPRAAPSSARRRSAVDGTAAWLEAIGAACGVARDTIDAAKNRLLPAIKARSSRRPIKGRITLSGYEGSELLVGRLLVESGADVRYVGTACPRTRWSDADRDWLEAKGVHVQFRASLEQDLAALRRIQARSRHRHDAGRAEGQAEGDPGALFHQPHLGAPADGPGRRRLARAGRQCRDRQRRRASTR